jgi:hypothetical protein
MSFPTTPSLRVKNSPGQLATIKRHALKGLDTIFVKKAALLYRTIKQ